MRRLKMAHRFNGICLLIMILPHENMIGQTVHTIASCTFYSSQKLPKWLGRLQLGKIRAAFDEHREGLDYISSSRLTARTISCSSCRA
jgi:hypothetical protein